MFIFGQPPNSHSLDTSRVNVKFYCMSLTISGAIAQSHAMESSLNFLASPGATIK